MLVFAEYIWIDGTSPVQKLRSKTKVLCDTGEVCLNSFQNWNFDGSSTNQAKGNNSECILVPVRYFKDPLRKNSYLVFCEVMSPDGIPHESNMRYKLRKTLKQGGESLEVLWGFEQEYCLMNNETNSILGWPSGGKYYPKPQGQYYCGIGADEVIGREIVHKHAQACLDAGLLFYGHNAEVMLGQWEFQIGYRGFEKDPFASALIVSDHLWLSRYLLYRIGEKYNVYATLTPKPKRGDWNGSGMHTNFSDKYMRDIKMGCDRIDSICEAMKENHADHQKQYGYGNKDRLTGLHETSPYDKFSIGSADRGASIRIPSKTKDLGYGYLEDRRPAANADPYVVTNRIFQTLLTCESGWVIVDL